MAIRVEHLSKRFGSFVAVDDVTFDVPTGALVALLGPSGGGKSTILRVIAGLESADAGGVFLEGEPVDHLHPRARGVGFVFQHYALFRHMTVAENVGFGLEVQGMPLDRVRDRVGSLLELLGLRGLDDRLPAQLSGGQRQRVALARALAPEPKILLLDEPFGAVDARVREELRRWLRGLHDELHVTSIFVTHDQEEAFAVADRVLVIHAGRLEQQGTPTEVLDRPASEFVARFIGDVNVFDGTVRAGRAVLGPIQVSANDHPEGARVRAVVRSHEIRFWPNATGIATVRRVMPLGDRVKVEAAFQGGGEVFASLPRESGIDPHLVPGRRVAVELAAFRLFPIRESTSE
jgi:sulfate transport system ATP-binding protein